MLYISRCVGRDKWGVVDTDDYVEEVVDKKQLNDIVLVKGIDIAGVTVGSGRISGKYGAGARGTYIRNVEVYQNPEYATRASAKAALLYGVDIKTSGKQIVSISVPGGLRKKLVKLRLSDFGESCGAHVLEQIVVGEHELLMLVMDDKIKITQKTFDGISLQYRVVIDLSEVTDRKTVERVYTCENFKTGASNLDIYIQDEIERLDFYKGVGILTRGVGQYSGTFRMSDLLRSPESTQAELEDYFGKSFLDLSNEPIALKTHPSVGLQIQNFVSQGSTREFMNLYKSGKLSWEYVKAHGRSVLYVLRDVTTMNRNTLQRFENYVTWFDATKELRQAYTRLCVRTIQWFNDYTSKKGWA